MKCLINNGADVRSADYKGRNALHLASLNGHFEVVEILVKNGADVSSESRDDRTTSIR